MSSTKKNDALIVVNIFYSRFSWISIEFSKYHVNVVWVEKYSHTTCSRRKFWLICNDFFVIVNYILSVDEIVVIISNVMNRFVFFLFHKILYFVAWYSSIEQTFDFVIRDRITIFRNHWRRIFVVKSWAFIRIWVSK